MRRCQIVIVAVIIFVGKRGGGRGRWGLINLQDQLVSFSIMLPFNSLMNVGVCKVHAKVEQVLMHFKQSLGSVGMETSERMCGCIWGRNQNGHYE